MHYRQATDDAFGDGVHDCGSPACGKLHGKWLCARHFDKRQAENDAMPDNMEDL